MNNNEINNQKNYKDINQNEFAKEVIEASKDNLIIVDFYSEIVEYIIRNSFTDTLKSIPQTTALCAA